MNANTTFIAALGIVAAAFIFAVFFMQYFTYLIRKVECENNIDEPEDRPCGYDSESTTEAP